jgi:signal transduction histidine kinase
MSKPTRVRNLGASLSALPRRRIFEGASEHNLPSGGEYAIERTDERAVEQLLIGQRPMSKRSIEQRVPAFAAAVSFLVTLAFSYDRQLSTMSLGATIALALLSAGATWISHFSPRLALLSIVVLCVGAPELCNSFEALELVVVYVLYQVTATSSLAPLLVAGVGFASLTVNDSWLRMARNQTFIDPSVLYPVILTLLAVGIGYQGRRVREQNVELIALREADRTRVVAEERRRIARDLHDVAAHHLSALVVRNKLARRVGSTESLEAAADFSATTASEALDSLRQVVGVLGNKDELPLSPQPTLADLEPMFARLAEAGVLVHREELPKLNLRRDVELAVFRITQEALTNVLRHRGPGQAWFSLQENERSVHLIVEDDGPLRDTSQPLSARRFSGHGLPGMTERAEACGGKLEVGRSTRGGWQISVNLPMLRSVGQEIISPVATENGSEAHDANVDGNATVSSATPLGFTESASMGPSSAASV